MISKVHDGIFDSLSMSVLAYKHMYHFHVNLTIRILSADTRRLSKCKASFIEGYPLLTLRYNVHTHIR